MTRSELIDALVAAELAFDRDGDLTAWEVRYRAAIETYWRSTMRDETKACEQPACEEKGDCPPEEWGALRCETTISVTLTPEPAAAKKATGPLTCEAKGGTLRPGDVFYRLEAGEVREGICELVLDQPELLQFPPRLVLSRGRLYNPYSLYLDPRDALADRADALGGMIAEREGRLAALRAERDRVVGQLTQTGREGAQSAQAG